MGVGVQKKPRCVCCSASLMIRSGEKTVECMYCHEIMEVTGFTQEERRLAAEIEELNRSLKTAEEHMEHTLDEWMRTSGAKAEALHHQAERQYEALNDRLTDLRNQYEQGKAKKLEGWFRLGEEAQHARRYDDAIGYYDHVLAEQTDEAQVHWNRLLCRYGVEYVKDQTSGIYLPTLTKMQVDNILRDEDYLAACEYAQDIGVRNFYEAEGKKLDAIVCRYQNICGSEAPYDVFISVKQGDEGKPTNDALVGLKLYKALSDLGLRVFNSAESLTGKAGTEYEPYIMHALSSARLMVVVASCEEYINSRWLRNEWRRFRWLRDSEGVHSARRLIVYSMKQNEPLKIPAEIGAIQMIDSQGAQPVADLCAAAREVFPKEQKKAEAQTVPTGGTVMSPLVKRMFVHLKYGEFDAAHRVYDQAASAEPENGYVYLGRLMIELQVREAGKLAELDEPFDGSNNYLKIMDFGDEMLKKQVQRCLHAVNERVREREAAREWQRIAKEREAARERERLAKGREFLDEEISRILQREQPARIQESARSALHVNAGDKRFAGKIGAGENHTVGLKADGTVYAIGKSFGGRCEVQGWRNITAISAGCDHTVGLRADRTVVATGGRLWGQCNVSGWKDIVAIEGGYWNTYGLKADGTVVSAGTPTLDKWRNIVAIKGDTTVSAHIVGLKSDGTVVMVGGSGDVSGWTDIVAIAAGNNHTFGVKSDGTVVAAGADIGDKRKVSGWTNIVDIAAGNGYVVGLKSDGTVVAAGSNVDGQCNVEKWTDIVAIAAGFCHTVGLKSDGTVITTGDGGYGRCNVGGWQLLE